MFFLKNPIRQQEANQALLFNVKISRALARDRPGPGGCLVGVAGENITAVTAWPEHVTVLLRRSGSVADLARASRPDVTAVQVGPAQLRVSLPVRLGG